MGINVGSLWAKGDLLNVEKIYILMQVIHWWGGLMGHNYKKKVYDKSLGPPLNALGHFFQIMHLPKFLCTFLNKR